MTGSPRVIAAALLGLLVAACTAAPSEPAPLPATASRASSVTALALCQSGQMPRHKVLTAGPLVTVGELRDFAVGPGPSYPLTHAFPGLPDEAAGTYCWSSGPDGYEGFAVAADGTTIRIATDNSGGPVPSGRPVTL